MTVLRLFPPLPRPPGAPAPLPAQGSVDADRVIRRFVEILSRVAAPPRGASPMLDGLNAIAREKIQ